jgi:hypothetical protein
MMSSSRGSVKVALVNLGFATGDTANWTETRKIFGRIRRFVKGAKILMFDEIVRPEFDGSGVIYAVLSGHGAREGLLSSHEKWSWSFFLEKFPAAIVISLGCHEFAGRSFVYLVGRGQSRRHLFVPTQRFVYADPETSEAIAEAILSFIRSGGQCDKVFSDVFKDANTRVSR